MKKIYLIFVVILFTLGCSRDLVSELEKSDKIEIFRSVKSGKYYATAITFKQSLDHFDGDSETFDQRILINHKGWDKPVVLVTRGYDADFDRGDELAGILGANIVFVPHRYYQGAKTGDKELKFLNLEQASADLHNIYRELKKVYRDNKWVATGVSKGGVTALAYKKYYPDDMDIVVPRSAPLIGEWKSKKAVNYISEELSNETFLRLSKIQEEIINREYRLLDYFEEKSKDDFFLVKFDDPRDTFYYYTEKYPMVINFLGGWVSSEIPDIECSDEELFYHFTLLTNQILLINSETINLDLSQCWLELGTAELKGLFKTPFSDKYNSIDDIQNPNVVKELKDWLYNNGERILYIYGENDIFTAFQVDFKDDLDSVKIIEPGEYHNLSIKNMESYDLVLNTINRWLEE